jgi:hypothetical protein
MAEIKATQRVPWSVCEESKLANERWMEKVLANAIWSQLGMPPEERVRRRLNRLGITYAEPLVDALVIAERSEANLSDQTVRNVAERYWNNFYTRMSEDDQLA